MRAQKIYVNNNIAPSIQLDCPSLTIFCTRKTVNVSKTQLCMLKPE